jgi:hypothetical protein
MGLTLISLFYPGKKVAGQGLGLAGRVLSGLRLVQQVAQAWGRVKKS